ncbi:MAG: MerR family transcriptional regulator [Chloroflexi bacterium]|nr:MAG: MerR family transcriptional regulator [Chloroflexota bacterium]
MRSGQVASQAGVNVETLRYYERRGLLPPPPREPSGYRSYGSEAVRMVRFVKRAQELGFSLDEVDALLDLAGGGPEACEAVQRLTGERIAELDRRIADLQAMRRSLQRLVATCHRPRSDRECPLIRSIEADAERGSPS